MTNQNLLFTATLAGLIYYFFYSKEIKSTLTPDDELESTIDKLITQIQQLTNQLN